MDVIEVAKAETILEEGRKAEVDVSTKDRLLLVKSIASHAILSSIIIFCHQIHHQYFHTQTLAPHPIPQPQLTLGFLIPWQKQTWQQWL